MKTIEIIITDYHKHAHRNISCIGITIPRDVIIPTYGYHAERGVTSRINKLEG